MTANRHHLYLDHEGLGENQLPVVYLHAYRGWVREVPGSFGKDTSGRWYITESIRTGYRVDA